MKLNLTKFQKLLCNILQDGLPVCWRPFEEIAGILNSDEVTVLQQVSRLKELCVVRRIRAVINYRALGVCSTLAAAHIPEESLHHVVRAVNALQSVSHNYQRNHHYNLWFTLQTKSRQEIDVTLSNLSGQFDVEFHSLPVRRVFKLKVRFDAQSQGQELLQGVEQIPRQGLVKISQQQKQLLTKLQNDLPVNAEPFDFLCEHDLKKESVLKAIAELIKKGVIRRIAAVVDHYKLGFTANVLFACEVPKDKILQAGSKLANFKIVSHCYERATCTGWTCNLFAMMHGRSMGQIQNVINKFIESEKIDSFQLLPTTAELKKQPVKYTFD